LIDFLCRSTETSNKPKDTVGSNENTDGGKSTPKSRFASRSSTINKNLFCELIQKKNSFSQSFIHIEYQNQIAGNSMFFSFICLLYTAIENNIFC